MTRKTLPHSREPFVGPSGLVNRAWYQFLSAFDDRLAFDGDDKLQVDGSTTANDTAMLLWDVNSGTLKRVSVGAADSGGAGFRLLRIVN